MVTIIGSHEVKDFATWKVGFDGDEANRAQFGLKSLGVFTSVENPNMVTFIFEAPNAEILQGMMSNPQFQETMKNAGVIGIPVVSVLNKM
jgi:hypothetical protein